MNLSPPNSTSYEDNLRLTLPEGDRGVISTLWVMAACVDDAIEAGGPVMRIATRIAATAGKGINAQIRGVYDFLQSAFIFKRDPDALEHVRHPDQLALELEANGTTSGDCDDVATLGAALVKAMGFKPALILASVRPNGSFHHVLFGAQVGNRLVYLDPQEGYFDQMPGALTRQFVLTW